MYASVIDWFLFMKIGSGIPEDQKYADAQDPYIVSAHKPPA